MMPRYGKTLESLLLKTNFRVSKESIYSLGIKLLDALELIHLAGFVFNDLKPDNIIFSYDQRLPADCSHGDCFKDQQLCLIDFGFATRYVNVKTGEHIPCKELELF